ncbi:MAG: murein L,D-transpeptidase catalytic domain family protein, partial [Chitinophagaceae bacterium]
LCLNDLGLSRKVFELALKGMDKLLNRDLIKHHILSIADFSKPSLVKRLFVIDLDLEELLFNTWVTHGRNSGALLPQYFSNKPRSKKSSLGFFVTGAPYNGSNGYSLRLQGLEPGFNTNAGMRGIVVHGSRYVGEDYIEQKGTVGRSLGCPAVPAEISESLINTIKEGSCLFIYHPSPNYLLRSTILK